MTFGGPDLMGREIAAGPEAVDATLEHLARGVPPRLLDGHRRVVLVGTGMSLAVAEAAAPFWRRHAREGAGGEPPAAVLVREGAAAAFDVDGETWGAGDVVVAVSKSGATPETVAAARAAASAGCRVIAVVSSPRSPLAALASQTVHVDIGEERGPGTKSGLAALAALLAMAGAIGTDARSRRALRLRLDAAVRLDVGAGQQLAASERTWIAGFGGGVGVARAGSILWHEKVLRAAVALSISELRHGPLESARPNDALIVIDPGSSEPRRAEYRHRLRTEAGALGLKTVWLVPDEPGAAIGTLESLARLQQLARATALAAGTYRDDFEVLRSIVRPAADVWPSADVWPEAGESPEAG